MCQSTENLKGKVTRIEVRAREWAIMVGFLGGAEVLDLSALL